MVILSVDYGDSRTGLAVCDALEMLASPAGVIFETDEEKAADEVVAEAKKRGAKLIVVGYPKNMDGTLGARAEKCEGFSKLIAGKSGIETALWDERLTTVAAHNALSTVNVRGKKRKNIVDAVSAVMILESYMSYRKNRSEN